MSELQVEHFGDPTQSAGIIEKVRRSWLDQQLADQVALLILLADAPKQREWATGSMRAFEMLGERGRVALLTDPARVLWQQLAETLVHGRSKVSNDSLVERFHLEHFGLFLVAAALRVGHESAEAMLPPESAWTFSGCGLTVVTEQDPVRCRAWKRGLELNGTVVPLATARGADLWQSVAHGDGWHALATPRVREELEHDARSPYLTRQFSGDCSFIIPSITEARILQGSHLQALEVLRRIWPELHDEIIALNRHLVSYCDLANPTVVSSFSNNSVPGALYISRVVDGVPISLGDLLDSIIHEHSHQKLYLLESLMPLYDPTDESTYPSPWKVEPRPIGGLLHGFFVFSVVAKFWRRIAQTNHELKEYGLRRIEEITPQLASVHEVLHQHAPFTPMGRRLFDSLSYVGETHELR